jgi:hypothetical protein
VSQRHWQERLAHPQLVVPAVAAAVTVLILAPLLRPGYVLSYDMLFVPHQPLTWDLIAPANGLPRAVPQDLVVSLVSTVVPGWLLQRVVLVAAVFFAALGAGRLVPTDSIGTRVVAAVGYAWSAYLAERLLIGQWGLLLAYAALPWLVVAAIGVRNGRPGAAGRMLLAAAVCAVTPTGGVIALATVAVMLIGGRRRAAVLGIATTVGLNAPWIVAALASRADGRSDPAGVAAFAARAENWSGPIGALLGTGGSWNAQTTPGSRTAFVVPLVTAVLLSLAVAGYPRLRAAWPDGDAGRLAALGLTGLAVAALGVFAPTAAVLRWLVAEVPGAGLLRDGQKFVLPYALLLAVTVALGAGWVAQRLGGDPGRLVLLVLAVLPLVALPDLAFGGLGALRPVTYPADWDSVASLVAADPGEVVSLPLAGYRRYPWNHGRTVIDAAPRYLAAPVTTDDSLVVGDVAIAGENGRAAAIRRLLEVSRPVADAGVRWVLVQRDAGESVPAWALAGLEQVFAGPELTLYRNPRATPLPVESGRFLLLVPYVVAGGVLMLAGWIVRREATVW